MNLIASGGSLVSSGGSLVSSGGSLLARTRAAFGAPGRSLPDLAPLTPPGWMARDELRHFYSRYRVLLETGHIRWGHVVQANTVLFRPGNEVAPGSVLFGATADHDLLPDQLSRAANATFALKGKALADPALARIGNALADEMGRHTALDLPPAVTRGTPMRMAIVVVHREFLPRRYFVSTAVPLVVSPSNDFATVLPARYWAPDLLAAWPAIGSIVC